MVDIVLMLLTSVVDIVLMLLTSVVDIVLMLLTSVVYIYRFSIHYVTPNNLRLPPTVVKMPQM